MRTLFSIWRLVDKVKYILVPLFFVGLLCFAGQDSVLAHLTRKAELDAMQEEWNAHRADFVADSCALERLENDPKQAERTAREIYGMKRQGEDIFIFVGRKDTLR